LLRVDKDSVNIVLRTAFAAASKLYCFKKILSKLFSGLLAVKRANWQDLLAGL
jgi:hypothetical protein